jgi:predicted alpha/beta hydrolase family esterase
MLTVILPGFSEQNKAWADETAKNLTLDHEIRPIYWGHWTNPAIKFVPEAKVESLLSVIGSDTVNFVAKSVGTLVAVLAIARIPRQVNKIVLCGMPMKDMQPEAKEIFFIALEEFPYGKITVFENESDPYGSYLDVSKFMQNINSAIVVNKKPGETHDYPYFSDFNHFLMAPEEDQ